MASKSAFYFSDGPYLQTLQGLYNALSSPEAFVKLLGPSRSGKSTICEKLSKYLKRKGYSVIYFRGAIESPDMLRSMLSRELDLPDSSNFPRLLEDALSEKGDKPLILLFDDAHLLTDITLLEIYRLAEVQIESKRVLNIVLCGESALEKRLLTNQEFKSLLLQVSHRFLLEPMDAEALAQFFYKYADYSGVPGLQLEQSAMNYFYKSCKGYPGPARDMCRLMVEARLGEAQLNPITRNELITWFKAAGSNQVLPSGQSQNSPSFGALMPLAAVIAIASVGFLYQQLQSQDDASAVEVATADIPQTIRPQSAEAAVSPFSDVEEDSAVTAAVEPAVNIEETVTNELPIPEDIPEPVSDSNLALVTAQERGVANDIIVEPEFEPMQEAVAETTTGQELEITNAIAEVSAPVDSSIEEEPSENLTEEVAAIDANDIQSDIAATADELTIEESPITVASSEALTEEVSDSVQLTANTEEPEDFDVEDREVLASEESDAVILAATESAESVPAQSASETTVEAVEQQEILLPAEQLLLPDVNELEAAVAIWVSAWEEKELTGYFASYHSGFVPRYQDTQADWRSNRRRVIGNAAWIRLEMSEFEFIGVDAGMMEVHFWLSYESPTYSDNTQKKLLMVEEEGEWRIMEEINLQVRS